jgi:hypothetical protein
MNVVPLRGIAEERGDGGLLVFGNWALILLCCKESLKIVLSIHIGFFCLKRRLKSKFKIIVYSSD